MIRTLLSTLITALLVLPYLNWSRVQTEQQIDKMQAAAFDTPGAESPVTPAVMGGGLALLLIHFIGARQLGLRAWQTLASLLMGVAIGGGIFLYGPWERTE